MGRPIDTNIWPILQFKPDLYDHVNQNLPGAKTLFQDACLADEIGQVLENFKQCRAERKARNAAEITYLKEVFQSLRIRYLAILEMRTW